MLLCCNQLQRSVRLAVACSWCWFVVREKYYWLAGGWYWFSVREKILLVGWLTSQLNLLFFGCEISSLVTWTLSMVTKLRLWRTLSFSFVCIDPRRIRSFKNGYLTLLKVKACCVAAKGWVLTSEWNKPRFKLAERLMIKSTHNSIYVFKHITLWAGNKRLIFCSSFSVFLKPQ